MSATNITNVKVFVEQNAGNKKASIYFTVAGTVSVRAAVMQGPKGLFIALPSRQYTDKTTGEKKYADEVKFANREVGDEVQKFLLSEYERVVKGGATTTTAGRTGATGTGTGRRTTTDIPF